MVAVLWDEGETALTIQQKASTVSHVWLPVPSHPSAKNAPGRFEVAAPPRFGLTCLRLKGVGCEGNRQLLAAVNRAGEEWGRHRLWLLC